MSVIDLSGKRIVITGASSGIGRAAATIMALSGARVFLVARSEDALKVAVSGIKSKGGEAHWHKADVAKFDETKAYVAAAREALGGIDGLFANAGTSGPVAPIQDYPLDGFEEVLSTNLRSALYAMQLVLPEMIARRSGSIALTGSIASERGLPMTAGYNISKHAVLGLVRSAASEVARHNVRVNCIVPGLIRTPMLEGLAASLGGGDVEKGLKALAKIPSQGRIGTPEEVGAVAAFLMTDAAAYVNGQSWAVDGGMLGAIGNGG